MKTLVIVAHPSIETSIVNSAWIKEIEQYPELFTIHELSKAYPDHVIDVEKEQALIATHGNLILQFPIQWFSSPPILKQWLDDVLIDGWAFGESGTHLKYRKLALAVSAGSERKDYEIEGRYHYTLEDILAPFEVTAKYCKADYQPFFTFYGTSFSTQEEIDTSAKDYVHFLKELR
ncbi:NAD(P)H-dependent oxidoreductase [Marinilactibacillus sp. XAAS-LB27]|uniref:NAD(P)H-dependent oxidoreductase n=1 Tax=Marinilactibacillus sp. XAAS-LB27 TaxID=3114538 RepID=UPI002E16BC12|nr:NAD(P)H-dependent oxidoreductase [Marinilactibacillus sp. XAAS-LB27]